MGTRVLLVGTGLIGASLGLALKALGPAFGGVVLGWDASATELDKAVEIGAIDQALESREAALQPDVADVVVLATPVLPILDWMERLAPVMRPGQLLTDVGSTKGEICRRAEPLYNGAGQACFLPSHPMAGKELGGAALAEADLFRDAAWLFTPQHTPQHKGECAFASQWRGWIAAMGAKTRDLDPESHDRLCAWISHLPQMLSTALAALLQEIFAQDAAGRAVMDAIGGRALRETTRLGASPYSMWRDIALTNTDPIAATLLALEQRLQHMRENLRTPELRDEFRTANRFRPR